MYCRQGQSYHGKFCNNVIFMYKLSLKTLKQIYFVSDFQDGVKFVFNYIDFKIKCFWIRAKMGLKRMFRFHSLVFCSCNNDKNMCSILNRTIGLHEDDK